MSSSAKFNFPFDTLTPITGKPTNTTLQLLQRQLFTNARSVPSARGGGLHGHLAILLSDADYIARVGVAFIIPVHPGPPPIAAGTAAAISVALRAYTDALDDVALYNNLRAALTAQILTAVNPSFLSALEDPDFGFGDITPFAMLQHLRNEYGTMTPEELERNRAALSEPWNFDDPIEDLWAKISNIQRVATLGALPIPDLTVITLTLAMIEKTGLLSTTTDKFRLRPTTEWTLDLFKAEFKLGNQERIRRLTASDAGFHGAHHATIITPPPNTAAAATTPSTATAPPPPPTQHVSVEGGKMYYCWSHGLSPNRKHTSATCLNKAAGHRDDATAFRMHGGNNTIATGRPRRFPTTTTQE
ncbi:hypothetical protein MHU86_18372 [Fragilaria crotonensis]|nr:hypothetical protein MHU86_18372 [Fragilaria crotonensis]